MNWQRNIFSRPNFHKNLLSYFFGENAFKTCGLRIMILMEFIQRDLLSYLSGFQPKIWLRYVEDIFAVFNKNCDIDYILNQLDSLIDSIKFTVQYEKITPFIF